MKTSLAVTKALSVFVIGVSVVILINYYSYLSELKTVLKNCQINFNTALCFFLAGIGLLFSDIHNATKTRRVIIDIISTIILIIGGVGLIELVFNVNFGIDTLFYSSRSCNIERLITAD